MVERVYLLDKTNNLFIDNEYFSKYIDLINKNQHRCYVSGQTQTHHIIPKCYFRKNNLPIDNSDANKVNLLYKDHLLAHCLLSLCTVGLFKYLNNISKYILTLGKLLDLTADELSLCLLSYELSSFYFYENNPMFTETGRENHRRAMQSDSTRLKISQSMMLYRKNHPFTELHRQRLSIAMSGNHNFGSGDTRSIPCYCIDADGKILHFHNYKQGGIWWFNNYKPFGDRYVQVTLQRNIKKSIEKCIKIKGIQWFKDEYD